LTTCCRHTIDKNITSHHPSNNTKANNNYNENPKATAIVGMKLLSSHLKNFTEQREYWAITLNANSGVRECWANSGANNSKAVRPPKGTPMGCAVPD